MIDQFVIKDALRGLGASYKFKPSEERIESYGEKLVQKCPNANVDDLNKSMAFIGDQDEFENEFPSRKKFITIVNGYTKRRLRPEYTEDKIKGGDYQNPAGHVVVPLTHHMTKACYEMMLTFNVNDRGVFDPSRQEKDLMFGKDKQFFHKHYKEEFKPCKFRKDPCYQCDDPEFDMPF